MFQFYKERFQYKHCSKWRYNQLSRLFPPWCEMTSSRKQPNTKAPHLLSLKTVRLFSEWWTTREESPKVVNYCIPITWGDWRTFHPTRKEGNTGTMSTPSWRPASPEERVQRTIKDKQRYVWLEGNTVKATRSVNMQDKERKKSRTDRCVPVLTLVNPPPTRNRWE